MRLRRGKKEILRYGGGRATALAYLQKLQGDLERMDRLGEKPQHHRTFAQFTVEYLAWSQRVHTKDTHDRARSLIQGAMLARFGERLLQEITQPEIERFLMSGSTWKAVTRSRYLSMISSIFKRAIELGYVQDNPAKGVRRAKEDRTPLPLVPADDQQKVLDALPPRLLLLAMLALDTGARQGELLRLRWADLDLAAKLVLAPVSRELGPRGCRSGSQHGGNLKPRPERFGS